MMKPNWIISVIFMLVLAACAQTDTPEPAPTISLDSGSSDSILSSTVIASAEIRPVDSVNLSFPQLGMVENVEVQVGDTVSAGQVLASLDTTVLEARVAEAQANVLAAEAQKALLKRIGSKQDQLDAAQAEVDRAQALVDQVKVSLEQATLYSPIDGTVVSVDLAPGETANPGQVVIVVAALDHLRVETTDLSERDIPAVQIGQSASVFIDALNQSFDGRVVDIDRQSQTVGGDVTYRVTIDLAQQPPGLRWGMSAEVEIQTEQ